jgi:hypothetical protein
MNLVDFILNLVGILLWINWRAALALKTRRAAISISGAIKREDPQPGSEWSSISWLVTMLLLRAVFYWNLGPPLKWTASLNLAPVSLPFRSDLFPLMLAYSFLSFGVALGVFFSSLLLLSCLHQKCALENPIQRFVRLQLGFWDRLPTLAKLFAPSVVSIVFWLVCSPGLRKFGILPGPASCTRVMEQALIMGWSAVLSWRGILFAILGAHILNTYLFLGNHPVWAYVDRSANLLLGPLRKWRIGIVDFGSIFLLAVIALLSLLFSTALARLFANVAV